MALGATRALGADVAVSITGIAGPDGGSDDKPVGTVWLGYALPGGADAMLLRLVGTRAEIRGRAAHQALYQLWRRLKRLPD
jgi:PncC family amidohydrolase